MRSPNRIPCATLAALAVLMVLAGCARAPLTAPLATGSAPAGVVAPPPPSRLSLATGATLPLDTLAAPLDWQLVQSVLVVPGVDAVVRGSHYTLNFAKGSLDKLQTITIKEYDSNVLDVQFGPHGTRFVTPVMLSIDFTGTQADPRSASADKSEPVLWYLNEATNRWEEVPGGVTDWKSMTFKVSLEHFSRYVLGGKAGWRHEPYTENDD